MKNTLVIIPTYNEVENIELLVREIFNLYPDIHVLVVDDNSPDGTADKVNALFKEFSQQLFLLSRPKKNGLGKAYLAGFHWGLKKQYNYFFQIDADFSHNPNAIENLYKVCANESVDVVIGSRYIQGINVVNWPLSRVMLSYLASYYVRLITAMPIKDPTAGFVCYHRRVLETIHLDSIQFVGYAFQIEMKYKAYNKKFKIQEIPIIFTNRIRGESKLTKSIISEAVYGVIQMRVQKILGRL